MRPRDVHRHDLAIATSLLIAVVMHLVISRSNADRDCQPHPQPLQRTLEMLDPVLQ
jgi:hypothetical protein